MTNCCASQSKEHKRHRCPVNGQPYKRVSVETIMYHIQQPWS